MISAPAGWLFLISLGASALGGALGMASGIFIVPLLTAVTLTGLWFLVHRDIPFALAAALVLCIIALSALLGTTVA